MAVFWKGWGAIKAEEHRSGCPKGCAVPNGGPLHRQAMRLSYILCIFIKHTLQISGYKLHKWILKCFRSKKYICAAVEHTSHCLHHGEALHCHCLSRSRFSYRLTCGFGVTGRSWLHSPCASSPPSHAPHSGCGRETCVSRPSSDQGILQVSCIFRHHSYK